MDWIFESGLQMETIEMENVEYVPSSEGIEDEVIQNNNTINQHSSKPHNVVLSGIGPTSVHELLECPVCTNSMYPPIHQVSLSLSNFLCFPLTGLINSDDT